jgi:hypothetical protein
MDVTDGENEFELGDFHVLRRNYLIKNNIRLKKFRKRYKDYLGNPVYDFQNGDTVIYHSPDDNQMSEEIINEIDGEIGKIKLVGYKYCLVSFPLKRDGVWCRKEDLEKID